MKNVPGYAVLSGARVARSLVFCVVFCKSLFVLFLLVIRLSVLRFTDSDYPFVIFKLFLFVFFYILSIKTVYLGSNEDVSIPEHNEHVSIPEHLSTKFLVGFVLLL